MSVEKSAGAIIFRKKEGKNFYLLLRYPASKKSAKDYWDFAKGHIEKGEKIEEAIKREAEEETGLKDIKFIEGFKEWIKYLFKFEGENIFKIVTFYLAETKNETVKISAEHSGFLWLPYEEAIARLTFNNARGILKKAHNFLELKI